MHIILGVVGLVVAAIVIFNLVSRNAGDVVDNARGLANLPRRLRWQARQRRLSIRSLEDPREAAVVLLLGIARASGDISSAQKESIADFAVHEFGMPRNEASDMILLANFMLRDVFDVADELRGILAPLEDKLGMDERHRLIDAARRVAGADGAAAGEAALALIDTVRQKLLPEALAAASVQTGSPA